jgi:hypothetical protein
VSLYGIQPGDEGIRQTVALIIQAVQYSLRVFASSGGLVIRSRAESIIAHCAERDQSCEVKSIFSWVSDHFRYVHDINNIETVKSPEVIDAEITANGQFQGDCDDVAGYLSALLLSIGYRVQLVIIVPPGETEFSHIYVAVMLDTSNKWVALDECAPQEPPGWAPPAVGTETYEVTG